MNKKPGKTALLIFFCCIYLNAFSNDIDSLKNLLASKSIHDTTRVNLLNALSKSYQSTNPDSAIIIAITCRDLAEKINFLPGLALAYKNIGMGHYSKDNHLEIIKAWQQSLEVYRSMQNKIGEANMLNNIGAVYFNQGDDAKALELYLASLKIAEEVNDTLRIATSLINVGAVYSNKKHTWKKALEYYLRAYKLSLSIKDDYTIGTSSVNIGEIYGRLGENDKALFYLNESLKGYAGTEDLPYSLNAIGKVYSSQNEFEKAIKIHKEALEYARKLDKRLDMTQSYAGLGLAYRKKGDHNSAIDAYKHAVNIGLPIEAVGEIKDAYEGLALSYAKVSKMDSAFTYQQLLLAIKDTIYNIETEKKLNTLNFTFEDEKKESKINLLNKDKEIQKQEIRRQKLVRNGFIGGFAILLFFASVVYTQRNRIGKEKKRSEELLLNILPHETAEELKATGTAKTKSFDSVTVLFTDFKNFTQASEILTPEELVAEINHCYSEFDRIVSKYGIEKIKTIGDSYMCAGGLPIENNTHPFDVVSAGIEMVEFIERNKQERISKGQPYFELRLGIHTGPVVAGIVGLKKFAYDIWGDTVNTASRMESSGAIGQVNISETTYEIVKNKFHCTHRGKVDAKHKGMIDMYFAERVTTESVVVEPVNS